MNRVLEYVEWHELQRRDAADLVREFADEIAEWRGTCLDVGCGPAVVTRETLVPALNERTKIVGKNRSLLSFSYSKFKFKFASFANFRYGHISEDD